MSQRRSGFSLIELLIVIVIAGLLIGLSSGPIGEQIQRDRVLRSATVVQGMLTEAQQLAVRRRVPITLTFTTADSTLRINLRSSGASIKTRTFGSNRDLRARVVLSPSAGVTFFPNGYASAAVSVTLSGAGYSTVVSMTRAGIVRRS